jgi:WD40 repeat protein
VQRVTVARYCCGTFQRSRLLVYKQSLQPRCRVRVLPDELYNTTIIVKYVIAYKHMYACAGQVGKATCVAFHPLASDVLAASHSDFSIRVWNLTTGDCCYALEGHTDSVSKLYLLILGYKIG